MDVTFFEKHAYYKSEIQGENVKESHLWESISGSHTDIIPSTHSHTPPLNHTHTHTPPLNQFSNPVKDNSSTS